MNSKLGAMEIIKDSKQPLTIVAFTSAALGIIVSLVILCLAVMFFFIGEYIGIVTSSLLMFTMIGVSAIVCDFWVILRTVRGWSWTNVMIIGLTVANVALTAVLFVLFGYFSQPLAGTGSP